MKGKCVLSETRSQQIYEEDMVVCKEFAQNSCCDGGNSRGLASAAPFFYAGLSKEEQCQNEIQKLNCYPCHPLYGLENKKEKTTCQGLCDSVFNSCSDVFYSQHKVSFPPTLKKLSHFYNIEGSLMPCQEDEVICTQLQAFFDNGTQFCESFGIQVEKYIENTTSYEFPCYDGTFDKSIYGVVIETPAPLSGFPYLVSLFSSPLTYLSDTLDVDIAEQIELGQIDVETWFLKAVTLLVLTKILLCQLKPAST